jgi:hypothetical protein
VPVPKGKFLIFPIMKKTNLTQPPRAPGTRLAHHHTIRPAETRLVPGPAPIAPLRRPSSRRLYADFLALCFYPGMDDHDTAA